MTTIFSTHAMHPDVEARLRATATLRIASAPTPEAILAEGADAEIIVVAAPIPPRFFEVATRLHAAVRHGTGLDLIPVEAATEAGVLVANAPGGNAASVAEHVVMSALLLARQFRSVDHSLRHQGWAAGRALCDENHDISGRRLGILGFGNIGRAVQKIALGFGMQLAATTHRPETLPSDVIAMDIDALCAWSDILVLCCPLTDATRGLISAARIGMMKPKTVLINVARGPVVDTEALIKALAGRHIAGAALDVFDTQPLPANSPIWHLDNVILTPHAASLTKDAMLRVGTMVADEIARILDGELPMNLCNPAVAQAWRARRFDGAELLNS
jgi:D-3-phosphoglycerate dehydrogenase